VFAVTHPKNIRTKNRELTTANSLALTTAAKGIDCKERANGTISKAKRLPDLKPLKTDS